MTTRTQNVYQFIKQYHARHGYAPTRREIGRGCNLSTSMVNYYLGILHDASQLTVTRYVSRGIALTEDAPDNADWQVLNRVATK